MVPKTKDQSTKTGNVFALDEQRRRVFLKFAVNSTDTATLEMPDGKKYFIQLKGILEEIARMEKK